MLPLLFALNTAIAPAAATPIEDLQAILVIELYRLPAPALDRFVESEDADVRARAALALSRLSGSPGRVSRLAALLDDADPEVRRAAAFGLGLADGGAPHLRAALTSEGDPQVRAGLLAALGMRARAEDIPLLVEGLSGAAVEAREAAVGLARMGSAEIEGAGDPAVLDALTAQLTRLTPGVREAAAFALARVEWTDEVLTPRAADALLTRIRREPDADVRALLTKTVGFAPGEAGAAALSRGLADSDIGVRVAAAHVAAHRRDAAAIEALLDDPAWSVRLAAIRGLAGDPPEGDTLDIAGLITPFTGSTEPDMVAAAVSTLGARGLLGSPRVWLQPDQPLAVQAAAIGTLEDTEQLLRLAADSPEASLRSAAAGQLAQLELSPETLTALLGLKDATAASAGAGLLADKPDEAMLPVLLARMDAAYEYDFWLEGLRAIRATLALPDARQPDGIADLVDAGLRSRDPSIRTAARALADDIGHPRAVPSAHFMSSLPPLDDILRIRSARILTDSGEIRVTLDPDTAPLTVWNFAQLAERDYFDGLAFHRVVPDFVIQAGCPRGDGWGGPGYAIPDELSWSRYDEGTLGMASAGPDTAGSQWFVTLSPQPHLEGRYTAFGHVSLDNGGPQRIRQGALIQDVIIEKVDIVYY